MAISNLKRFVVPSALVIGGVTAGSMLAPVAFAAADDQADDSTADDTATESQKHTADSASEGTDDQADRRSRRGHRARHALRHEAAEVLTETLGLSRDELRSAMDDGKSLADIAADKGVSTEDLKATLLAAAEERIDQAVTNGHIDTEKAEEMKAQLADRIDEHINKVHDGSERDGKGHWGRHGHGMNDGRAERAAALAEFLGLSTDDLRAAHQDGQTMAETAEAQGVSEDDLVAFLLEQAQDRIDGAVEDGKIEADQVDEILAEIEARIEERIHSEPGDHPGHRMGRGHGLKGQRSGISDDVEADGDA